LRESERAQEHCILLPLYHQMVERDWVAVAAALKSALPGWGMSMDTSGHAPTAA
jgi:dTDP-4-amino-4,6-dideoxygalactose transaminase